MLDLFYCNVKNSYKAYKQHQLGSSDHSLVYLAPVYKQKLKTGKVQTRTIKKWDASSVEQLQGCLAGTDWSVFLEDNPSLDVLTDTVTSYIRFCEDLTKQTKTLKIFPNSKPWVTSELKQKIKEKHRFRLSNNKEEMKRVQKELNVLIHKCKVDYKSKIEKRFESNNIRAAWDGLKTITGYFKKSVEFPSDNLAKLANELNKFYCRFDVSNRDAIPSIPCDSVMDVPCEITKEEVARALRKINVRKACGPDGLSPRLLNVCSLDLCDIFHILFNESVFSGELQSGAESTIYYSM